MTITALAALAIFAQGPTTIEVAYPELDRGDEAAAIATLSEAEGNPAQLINLGIAYAREGETSQARAMFEAAMRSDERLQLETADGRWEDSRWLAREALARLDRGDFAATRVATR